MKNGSILINMLALSLVVCGTATKAAAPVGSVSVPQSAAPAGSASSVTEQEYRIQVGDQLDIKFFYNPELNEQVIVRPDGRISLQLIQEIVVSDLTPAMLTTQLNERYAAELRQPRVTVIVRAFGSQRVFVDGEVSKPGVIPIVGLMTALQAISQAGGMKETARSSEVIIIRRGPANKPLSLQVDLKRAGSGKDLSQDVTLSPFDIIFVPRSTVANVNVWIDQYIRQNIPIPFSIYYGNSR